MSAAPVRITAKTQLYLLPVTAAGAAVRTGPVSWDAYGQLAPDAEHFLLWLENKVLMRWVPKRLPRYPCL